MASKTSNSNAASSAATRRAAERMENDPDIRAERLRGLGGGMHLSHQAAESDGNVSGAPVLPLNVYRQKHHSSDGTSELLTRAGGIDALREFTSRFYEKAFQDPQLDPFIRARDDPHAERFACWIAEKFGHGTPWADERRSRVTCPFHSHGHTFETPFDRSSAHYAAWHSPKRSSAKFGQHFKLDDCRVWMRLHFWAAREAGLFERAPDFMDYYIRFIGHFVSVYERSAPPFARESARWSSDPANTARYEENGRRMEDVVGLSLEEALEQLPPEERKYTGSSGSLWPYER